MRTRTAAILMTMIWAGLGLADDHQTDWSGGPGEAGPVGTWTSTFDAATGVSWRAVPDQLALSSVGQSSSTPHSLGTGYYGAFGIEAADLDGDGDMDMVGAAETARTVTIWHNDGADPPTFTPETIDQQYIAVAAIFVVDIDADEDLDIIASSGSTNGIVKCYLNDGGTPAAWTIQEVDPSWGEAWEISAADVDGDGNTDVVGTSLSFDSVVWWRNDGQSPIGWTRHTVDSNFDGAHSARAGDLDGDGHADIVACGTTVNEVAWWKNSGDQPATWTKTVIESGFVGGRSVRIADIDDDGDPDLGAVGFNGRVTWWSNEGGDPVVWTTQVVAQSLSQVHQLQIVDLNGDGRLDMLAALYGSNGISWWENGGDSPITWTRHSPASLNRPLAVHAGDVDGDGALEILSSTNTLGRFFWYDATTFVAEGSLTSAILDRGQESSLTIDWNATTPGGTSLSFQIRSGADAGALGLWSGDISSPGNLDGTVGRYLQYRVFLSTVDAAVSPQLEAVEFRSPVSAVLPGAADLHLNAYPNPANPRVTIAFDLPRSGMARLEIFDTRGRRVRTLADESFAAGRNEIAWNGDDAQGRAVATGTYHVRLSTGQGIERSRVTLVR